MWRLVDIVSRRTFRGISTRAETRRSEPDAPDRDWPSRWKPVPSGFSVAPGTVSFVQSGTVGACFAGSPSWNTARVRLATPKSGSYTAANTTPQTQMAECNTQSRIKPRRRLILPILYGQFHSSAGKVVHREGDGRDGPLAVQQ